MLVVSMDTIPGKKIVKVLGAIQARNNPLAFTLDMSKNAQKYLEKEAEKIGANAIVGYRVERQQERRRVTYYMYGTAVIAEDE